MTTPEEILQHMRVEPGVYVIGCFERRVTLYSQQIRALNLVYSLANQGLLKKDSMVAVIGAGPAGMTAAAAAAKVGAQVTLIEQRSDLIQLFQSNTTRWIHPHVYDWPSGEVEADEAGLPLLNWSAAYAGQVAEQFIAAWDTLPDEIKSRIDKRLGAQLTSQARRVDDKIRLAWNAPEGSNNKAFTTVIVAVGFGVERGSSGIPVASYWRNDDIDQPEFEPKRPLKKILVSGCGDGGLIEVIRSRITRFRHDSIIRDFLHDGIIGNVAEQLLKIEQDAVQQDKLMFLHDAYDELVVPVEIDALIKRRLRIDTAVVLNGVNDSPITRDASILNRFLVSRLCRYGGVRYISGRLGPVKTTESGYDVKFADDQSESFDRVLLRHGPEDAVSSLATIFPALIARREALRAMSSLDQTRSPIWDQGYFGAIRPADLRASAPSDVTIIFNHPRTNHKKIAYQVDSVGSFGELADMIYFESRVEAPGFNPYRYGTQWVLREQSTGRIISHMRMLTHAPVGAASADDRTLRQVGIEAGMTLEVIPPAVGS